MRDTRYLDDVSDRAKRTRSNLSRRQNGRNYDEWDERTQPTGSLRHVVLLTAADRIAGYMHLEEKRQNHAPKYIPVGDIAAAARAALAG